MKPSDKGNGIYEYCLDRPYEYIAFMAGTDGWDYTEATTPVYTEWDFRGTLLCTGASGRRRIHRQLGKSSLYDLF